MITHYKMRRNSLFVGSKLTRRAFCLLGIQLLFALHLTSCVSSAEEPAGANLQHGELNNGALSLDITSQHQAASELVPEISARDLLKYPANTATSTATSFIRSAITANNKQGRTTSTDPDASRTNKARRQEEILSKDCIAKRNEVLSRQQTSHGGAGGSSGHSRATPSTTANPLAGFQRLRPKVVENNSPPVVLNVTLANNFDGEHVPRCRLDGSYDPVQCHKIGYCWCVNKFGQAIKNSAVQASEEPECDPGMYESDGNDHRHVVAGISAQRIKGILKNGSSFVSSTPNGHVSFEATEPTSSSESGQGHYDSQQVDAGRSATSHGPVMPLMPNDCSGSRANARERAATQINDSIWVPECDNENEKLYAEQQCHRSRVCWCVDQATGLPLRTSEQLSSRPLRHNCTEIKRILNLQAPVTSGAKPQTAAAPPTKYQAAFYQGSSEYCDTDKRLEFVVSLSNQFRQQISEYLRQNPTSSVPAELSSTNPYLISELQVAKWKFSIMDRDMDGKIGDREWSKFKNNFKLVDKVSELDNPFKQQKSPYFTMTPLLIVRSQRKCWRDFLEFCGNGELVDESISLAMWIGCTEVPTKLSRDERVRTASASDVVASPSENTYALSREAAIVRSQKKNPFLGILKPD